MSTWFSQGHIFGPGRLFWGSLQKKKKKRIQSPDLKRARVIRVEPSRTMNESVFLSTSYNSAPGCLFGESWEHPATFSPHVASKSAPRSARRGFKFLASKQWPFQETLGCRVSNGRRCWDVWLPAHDVNHARSMGMWVRL